MSPSAYLRGAGNSILYTLGYLSHLEQLGLRVINGSRAYQMEINKGLQLQLLHSLGLGYPKAIVINHTSLAVDAASDMRFPIVIKANIGGSGAGIVRFDSMSDLVFGLERGNLDFGVDSTALVQEYITPGDGRITRVETLGGKYLYAINVYTSGASFNLCPADICQTTGGVELTRNACPVDAPKSGLRVEAASPSAHIIQAIERIAQSAHLDVGGIEYMVDSRDGSVLYYDINALSNFVADAVNVIGFDPHVRLVDFLVKEAANN
jgi:predicted ATP-grasp superfamily ATP-dependent carboligase